MMGCKRHKGLSNTLRTLLLMEIMKKMKQLSKCSLKPKIKDPVTVLVR